MTSPGYISIAAVAVLQFPHAIEPEKGRRHVVMDATFFVVEGSRTATVGLLRYFASNEMANEIYKIPEKEFQRAFVVANISSIAPNSVSTSLMLEDQEITDYAFGGDIQNLILLDDDVDMKVNPYITVAGTIASFDSEDHTFTMTPTQYIGLIHASSGFPIHAHFVDRESKKRWGSNGPKAAVGSTITFGGFLERVARERDINKSLSFAEVEVTNIAYLSNRGNNFVSPGRSNEQTPGSRRRWNYNNPPSSTKGKRKRDEESEDDHLLKREKTVDNEEAQQ